jgi:hypothetical protein
MKTPRLYNLVVQSEDQNSTLIETLVYALLVVSAVVSIGYAALQPVIVPSDATANESVAALRA